MAELDQFEARLGASLEHLADEVPTAVDSRALTAAIVSADAGHGWLRPTLRDRPMSRTFVVRYALVAAALLLSAAALAGLASRFLATPFDPQVHGQMTCTGPSWTAASGNSIVLECSSTLPDARLSGDVRITLGAVSAVAGITTRSGSMTLWGDRARWTGVTQITGTPNQAANGDVVLTGEGAAEGHTLHLHLMSGDGRTWGLLGTVSSGRQ